MKRIRSFFARFGRYELIAFVTGFVLMSFELVASRLLAPTIGSSTYVWTSVIGVMIAALALGYAFGGWLADKRVAVLDVALLLCLSAVMTAGTLVVYDSVLALLATFLTDARIAGVTAAVTLFMPTSFLLGVISPYLARLRVTSIATAGRSVAGLSALNSLGGITGTFITGFVFFSYIGSRESLALLVVILLACSWLLVPRRQTSGRAVLTIVVCVLVGMEILPASRASAIQIDTASGHYQVDQGNFNGRKVKVLVTGATGVQSGIYVDGPRDLVFPYAQVMADVVAQAPHKERILMLGGGVFTLPEHLAQKYPDSQVDVVEIDPVLKDIAVQYFGYSQPSNVRVIADDARAYVQNTHKKYDIILVDVFNEQAVPFSLTTQEFTQRLSHITNPGGIVAVNIISGLGARCEPLLASLQKSYRSAFANSQLIGVTEPTLQRRQNIIGVYSAEQATWLTVQNSRDDIPHTRAITLTDNFAPVEPLVQNCR